MGRLWTGVLILTLLLALGVGITVGMETLHGPLEKTLQQAAEAAGAGDWEQASHLVKQARSCWEASWHFTAAVADHTPMDEMDGLFAELQVYLENREQPHFAATALSLSQMARAMADSHTPHWWNVL